MKLNKNYLEEIKNFPKPVKLIALATLISNIGNGMNLIAVSKLAYDKTNSAMAFGGVLVVQYIVMFLVQFISGAVVDRNNPKNVIVISDIARGTLILTSGLMCLFSSYGVYYLVVALVFVYVINPFFATANFCILPEVVKYKELLLKSNGIITTLFQTGQLCGSASVAVIIYFFSPAVALVIDGITFFISAFIFSHVALKELQEPLKTKGAVKAVIKDFFADWKDICKCLKEEKSLFGHLFASTGDYLAVNFFNVMLVPMVTAFYDNNSFNISLFDCGFAIGSMIVVLFITSLSKKIGVNNSAVIGILIQGIVLVVISLKINLILAFLLLVLYGMANSFSITIFSTNLQKRCMGRIKGRVNSVKNFFVSCLTIVLVPLVSKMYDVSIVCGLLTSSAILVTYGLISFVMGRKFVFGEEYLTKTIAIDKN
ncbi:MFS-type transporter involved in bile tolerance, Atg22 family [Clostridium sp. DSM 8431]|uniref:MFS transporter n=1 Tax=Clostridium sp. DSM 8431 TaxID=1761781 RepID=UPI0008EEED0D|nr:MFS transporter [Clostridium sp. DSM 8431]SFU37391.1 MFS-type transporter involved in bile tolerance, Atg22 family [Clostridium sp. DSM 8431]